MILMLKQLEWTTVENARNQCRLEQLPHTNKYKTWQISESVIFLHYREVADSHTVGIFIRDTACFHCGSMNCDS